MPMESSPEPPAQASTPSRPAETEAKPSLPWDDEDESPEDDDQLADASESDEDEPAEEDEQRVLQGDNNQSKADRRTTTTTTIQPPTQPSAAIPASRGGLIKPEVGSPTQAAPPTRTPQSPAGAINPTPVVEAERASVSSHSRTLGSPDSPFPQPRQLPVAPPPKPPAPPSAATRDRTPSKPIEPIQTEAPKSTPPSDGAVSRPSPKPEPTPARSKTLANAELTTKASPSRKSDDQDERKTQKKTAPPSAAKNGGKGDKPVKPAFSASLLSQQIAEVSADIYRQRSDEMRDKKTVYATEVKTNRLVVAAYEQAWQEKVERIGNLNYPDEARRDKLSGTLMVAVGIKPDGSVYSVQVQQPSGHEALDNAARNIVRLAAPFAPLPQEIRNEVDILVITRTWRFDSNYHLETRVR